MARKKVKEVMSRKTGKVKPMLKRLQQQSEEFHAHDIGNPAERGEEAARMDNYGRRDKGGYADGGKLLESSNKVYRIEKRTMADGSEKYDVQYMDKDMYEDYKTEEGQRRAKEGFVYWGLFQHGIGFNTIKEAISFRDKKIADDNKNFVSKREYFKEGGKVNKGDTVRVKVKPNYREDDPNSKQGQAGRVQRITTNGDLVIRFNDGTTDTYNQDSVILLGDYVGRQQNLRKERDMNPNAKSGRMNPTDSKYATGGILNSEFIPEEYLPEGWKFDKTKKNLDGENEIFYINKDNYLVNIYPYRKADFEYGISAGLRKDGKDIQIAYDKGLIFNDYNEFVESERQARRMAIFIMGRLNNEPSEKLKKVREKDLAKPSYFKEGGSMARGGKTRYGVYVYGQLHDDFSDELLADAYAHNYRSIHPTWDIKVKPVSRMGKGMHKEGGYKTGGNISDASREMYEALKMAQFQVNEYWRLSQDLKNDPDKNKKLFDFAVSKLEAIRIGGLNAINKAEGK